MGRDGKVDYDKLFETLQNQSFRRRWIRSGISYLADWTNFLSNPEVYQRYKIYKKEEYNDLFASIDST